MSAAPDLTDGVIINKLARDENDLDLINQAKKTAYQQPPPQPQHQQSSYSSSSSSSSQQQKQQQQYPNGGGMSKTSSSSATAVNRTSSSFNGGSAKQQQAGGYPQQVPPQQQQQQQQYNGQQQQQQKPQQLQANGQMGIVANEQEQAEAYARGEKQTANATQGQGATKTPSKPPKIVRKRLRKIEKPPTPYDKYAWIAGHITCIVFSIIYSAYYFTFQSHKSWFPIFCYRAAFAGVIIACFVSMVNAFGKLPPSYFALMTTDNFQYLCLAAVWFFNRSSFFKVLPYTLVSLLQLSQFFKIKPVLKMDKPFREIIVYDEMLVFVLLFIDTLLMRGTSGYALVIFTLFYSIRLVFNDEPKGLVYSFVIKLDGVMSKQKNPKLKALWHDIKSFLAKKRESGNQYSFHIRELKDREPKQAMNNEPITQTFTAPRKTTSSTSTSTPTTSQRKF